MARHISFVRADQLLDRNSCGSVHHMPTGAVSISGVLMCRALAASLLVGLLALAACTASTDGTTGGGTPTATTAKAKPTALPTITLTFCQHILSVAEANQLMQPATPAVTIRVDNGRSGGSCNWEYSSFHAVVSALFLPYNTTVSLDTIVTQALAQAQIEGATFTKTPVSGVGDQALYVTGTASIGGRSLYEYLLDTTYGSLYISCWNSFIGSAPASPQQAPLTQVCQQVISRL
jgi:hypothetical protein